MEHTPAIPPRSNDGSAVPVRFQIVDTEAQATSDDTTPALVEYWRLLLRHKATVLLVAFAGAVAGLLVSIPQTPIYQAHLTLEIQSINENFLNMGAVNPTLSLSFYPEYEIQTNVRVLQSGALIERVVNKLKLEKEPDYLYDTDRPSAWRKALGLPPAEKTPAHAVALGTAAGSLRVRTTPQTRIVELTCDSTSPKLAADFANTLANEFMEQNVEARWNATQRTGEWLTRQMEDLKIKLEKSEERLQAYALQSGLMFTGEKDHENVAEAKLRQMQEELSKAQGDRVSKQSRYEMLASTPLEALPVVLDDTTLREYQAKLAEMRRQLAEFSQSMTPAHYKVKRLEAQIAELEGTLIRERDNALMRIRNESQAAERREKMLAQDYSTHAKVVSEQAGKAIHYNILRREVETNRQLYENVLQKVKEAGISSAMRASNVRVVDPARPPGAPYKPNHTRSAVVGLFFGLVLGAAFVLVREQSDRSLKEPGDASLYLDVPELGAIPSGLKEPAALPGLGAGQGVEMVTWREKPSLVAESFRATLTSILFSGKNGDRPRVLLMTSPAPGEGKTTAVCNLGIAIAEINRRVLLVDGDMRKPRLHDIFGASNDRGLSTLLCERDSVEDLPLETLVRETAVPGLFCLPSGPGNVSISNLLYSPRAAELVRRFRREFDTVLIDSPPMMQMSDARVLGRLADAVILVFRAGETTRDSARAARQRFAEDGTPVLGTILNSFDPKAGRHYGYYSGYYNHYYGRDRKDG